MEKNLYIDASHPNETRIVLKSDSSIEEYEYENKNKINFKNNIYLGTVSRVEPSLQAAFINFGRLKHGFLAFNDIQSDYYQIPTEDKEKLREAEEKIREDLKNTNHSDIGNGMNEDDDNKKNNENDLDGKVNTTENSEVFDVKGIDKMTYAANTDLLDEFNKYNNFSFVKCDINDLEFLYDCGPISSILVTEPTVQVRVLRKCTPMRPMASILQY